MRQTTLVPSASTSIATCTWPGHCLGDTCQSEDDCDNDWVCSEDRCSPCCESSAEEDSSTSSLHSTFASLSTSTATTTAAVSTTSTTSSTATATEEASGSGLDTASSIGIGVGVVVFVILGVVAGFWIWTRRRKGQGPFEAPDTHRPHFDSYGASTLDVNSDQKKLMRGTAELPCPTHPAELSSIELVELDSGSTSQGKHSDNRNNIEGVMDTRKDFVASSEPARSPRYRFEEYSIAQDDRASG